MVFCTYHKKLYVHSNATCILFHNPLGVLYHSGTQPFESYVLQNGLPNFLVLLNYIWDIRVSKRFFKFILNPPVC